MGDDPAKALDASLSHETRCSLSEGHCVDVWFFGVSDSQLFFGRHERVSAVGALHLQIAATDVHPVKNNVDMIKVDFLPCTTMNIS